jgi:hypothetical protein
LFAPPTQSAERVERPAVVNASFESDEYHSRIAPLFLINKYAMIRPMFAMRHRGFFEARIVSGRRGNVSDDFLRMSGQGEMPMLSIRGTLWNLMLAVIPVVAA